MRRAWSAPYSLRCWTAAVVYAVFGVTVFAFGALAYATADPEPQPEHSITVEAHSDG